MNAGIWELDLHGKNVLQAKQEVDAALKKAVDAGDKDTVEKYAKLLYGQAELLAGLPLEDPAGYAQLVCSLMV